MQTPRWKSLSIAVSLLFAPAVTVWVAQLGYAYGQTLDQPGQAESQLLARECSLTAREVISLIDEQLDKTVPDGSLWVKAGDRLIQELTGCKTDPIELLSDSVDSVYFNPNRSSKNDPKYIYKFTYSKDKDNDRFSVSFAICKRNIDNISIRCQINQIVKVTSILEDVYYFNQ